MHIKFLARGTGSARAAADYLLGALRPLGPPDLAPPRRRQHHELKRAHLVGSSQSRVAKMEAADASVSVDLLIRSLLKLGAARKDLAKKGSIARADCRCDITAVRNVR